MTFDYELPLVGSLHWADLRPVELLGNLLPRVHHSSLETHGVIETRLAVLWRRTGKEDCCISITPGGSDAAEHTHTPEAAGDDRP